ncbi:MAG: hypothetical protein K2Q18_10520 [Bdellovibrionales bacterium]|nr:hypothetical protein [Bdellovibrionales bacterium]
MQFFKSFLMVIVLTSGAFASEVLDIIQTKEIGSCKTKDLSFTAMKFYKIPLVEKYEDFDVYLRVILFFNLDGSLSMRLTKQALIACSGEACSFKPLSDTWIKDSYSLDGDVVSILNVGSIAFNNPENTNRGFTLKFSETFPNESLRLKSFIGGMISTNFNQDGLNVINICK